MVKQEEVEKILADLRRRRTEAEAEAGHAAEALARLVSGMTPLKQVDTDQVRATADTFADAAERLRALEEFARQVRGLLL